MKLETDFVKESIAVSVWNYGDESEMSFQLKYIDDETGDITDEYNSEVYLVEASCSNFKKIMNELKLWGSCSIENLDNSGAVIVIPDELPEDYVATEVKGYKYTHELYYWRADKKLPFFITKKLKGFPGTRVEHVNEGTDTLGGEFSINVNDETMIV